MISTASAQEHCYHLSTIWRFVALSLDASRRGLPIKGVLALRAKRHQQQPFGPKDGAKVSTRQKALATFLAYPTSSCLYAGKEVLGYILIIIKNYTVSWPFGPKDFDERVIIVVMMILPQAFNTCTRQQPVRFSSCYESCILSRMKALVGPTELPSGQQLQYGYVFFMWVFDPNLATRLLSL